MRDVRRWLLAVLAGGAGLWLYAIAGAGGNLLALLDGGRATTTAPPRVDSGARATPASREIGSPEQRAHVSLAAERGEIRPPEPLPSDAISDAQIMRLLEAELAADADPAAADALLRSLGEALHAPQSEP